MFCRPTTWSRNALGARMKPQLVVALIALSQVGHVGCSLLCIACDRGPWASGLVVRAATSNPAVPTGHIEQEPAAGCQVRAVSSLSKQPSIDAAQVADVTRADGYFRVPNPPKRAEADAGLVITCPDGARALTADGTKPSWQLAVITVVAKP